MNVCRQRERGKRERHVDVCIGHGRQRAAEIIELSTTAGDNGVRTAAVWHLWRRLRG